MIKQVIAALSVPAFYLLLYKVLDYSWNMEKDAENHLKFYKAMSDIQTNGILNAVMLNKSLSQKEAAIKILGISIDIKHTSTTANYNAELFKSLAAYLSGITIEDLEERKYIHDKHLQTEILLTNMLGRITPYLSSLHKEIYKDGGELNYDRLDSVIQKGNEELEHDIQGFYQYTIHNERYKIDKALADADSLKLEDQINELHDMCDVHDITD